MRILALDTSTEACSAALYIDGEIASRFQVQPRGHADLLLPMVDELLAEAGLKPTELDAVAFGRGPGSFTGLRIAAGITQGIAFGADLPVAPVSTLAAMAQSAIDELNDLDGMLVAIDARMEEVYWGVYQPDGHGLVRLSGVECVCMPDAVPLPDDGRWLGLGTGWGSYRDALTYAAGDRIETIDAERLPHAADIVRLAVPLIEAGQTVPAEQAAPIYLRDNVARKRNEQ